MARQPAEASCGGRISESLPGPKHCFASDIGRLMVTLSGCEPRSGTVAQATAELVAPMRFELMASGLGILRSILLSYGVLRLS